MEELFIFAGPPVVTATTALISAAVFQPHRLTLSQTRIPRGLLIAQAVIVPLSWLVIWAAPDKQNWRERAGATCPVLEGRYDDVLFTLVFASALLGGVACGAAIAADWPRLARAAGYAAAALVLPYFMMFTWIGSFFCGMS